MSPAPLPDQAQRLARNFRWLSLQEFLIRLIGLVTSIYLARVLGARDYGTLGLALAIVGFTTVFARSGSGTRGTRLTARDPSAVPRIYGQIAGMRLIFAIALIGVLAGFSGFIGPILSLDPGLLALCSLMLLPSALSVAWAFRGLDQMRINALSDIAEKCLTFAAVLCLVRGPADVKWAPVAEAVSALMIAAWLHWRLNRQYPGLRMRLNVREWPEISRETLPLGLNALLNWVFLNACVILLGWLAAPEQAAMFLVAQKIMLTLALLMMLINQAAFPSISRMMRDDRAGAVALAARLLRYYLVLTVPACLLVAFHARELLVLAYGPAYAAAGGALITLLAALPFHAVNGSLNYLLMAMPRPAAVLSARLCGAAVLLALGLLLIPRFQTVGAAAALAASEATSSLLLFLFTRRVTGRMPWDRRCLTPVLAGAAAAVCYTLLHSWPLLLKLPCAAAVYLLGALAFGAITTVELRSLSSLLLARRTGEPQRK